MKTKSIFFLLLLILSCNDLNKLAIKQTRNQFYFLDSLRNRNIKAKIDGGLNKLNSNEFYFVRNAAYGYNYYIPKSFEDKSIELLDKDGYLITDTVLYKSKDNEAYFKIWIGESFKYPISFFNIIHFDAKIKSQIIQFEKSNMNQTDGYKIDSLLHGVNSVCHEIVLICHNSSYTKIYKVEFSEIPISGNLISKNYLFVYDTKYANKFQSMAISLTNEFGLLNIYD